MQSGEFSTEKSVKSGRAYLVIVSEEASENTKKKFRNMCTYYEVPYFEFGSKEELGHATGREMRASLAVPGRRPFRGHEETALYERR